MTIKQEAPPAPGNSAIENRETCSNKNVIHYLNIEASALYHLNFFILKWEISLNALGDVCMLDVP